MISFSKQQHIFAQIFLISTILTNIYWLNSPAIGLILGIGYLWLNSKKIAEIFAKNIHRGLKNIIGFLTILSYISLIYTISYHIYQINFWVFLFVLISIPIIVEILSYYHHIQHYFFENANFSFFRLSNIRKSLLPLVVLILDIILLTALNQKASLGIIRSPWELVGFRFWLVFTLSNLALVTSIIDKKSFKNILLISFHFIILSTIALILYPLGFGYDSFIHQSVLNTISQTGTIEPRLFFYVGQYGLSFFFHNILQIPLATVNSLLLPALFSLLWPSSLFYGLRYGFNWSFKNSYLATLWSLFIGFNFAIMTTPQSLSYLLVAIFIFLLPEINKRNISIYFALILSLMTITIHPLGGIPLLIFTILLSIWQMKKRKILHKTLLIIVYLGSTITLPLLFALYQKLNNVPWNEIFSFKIWPVFFLREINFYQTFNFPLDMIHNIGSNQVWLYALIVLLGLYYIFKKNKYIFFKRLIMFNLILVANYLIANIFLSFNLQIDYQKTDYINRIAYLIAITSLPIFVTAIYFFFKTTIKNNLTQKIFLIISTILIISISTYFSYPIYDQHRNSKSFNVTATDLKTVEIIENDAQNTNYIVLANQMVGVAAIHKFGFAHYYNENFYYSMPLGNNNIYQNYLKMIESQASQEEALLAMNKAEVDKLYFVVNNYWHSAKQAIQQAELSADEKILIDNGVNTIFVYNR